MPLNRNVKATGLATLMIGAAAIAAHFVFPFEGEKFSSYRDGGGMWTICRGHTDGVHEGQTATKEQCDGWYAQDINVAQAAYEINVHTIAPENVQAAAISFIFNTGAGKFKSSTLLRRINKGDFLNACNEFPRWHYLNGRDCAIKSNNCYGLVIRRQSEKELCLEKNHCNSFSFGADNIFHCVSTSRVGR